MVSRVERSVTIVNPQGMHARPAAEFVKMAARFTAEVTVAKDGLVVNGKSILGVMTLAAECGSRITIVADGPDADEAVAALTELIARGFGEP